MSLPTSKLSSVFCALFAAVHTSTSRSRSVWKHYIVH